MFGYEVCAELTKRCGELRKTVRKQNMVQDALVALFTLCVSVVHLLPHMHE